MTPQSCDTMVAPSGATRNGQTLFAKNSDRPADECQPLVLRERRSHVEGDMTRCQFVTFPEAATTWRHVGSRPYWCWGYEHGFNEHQVVIGNEALGSKFEPAAELRLIGMEVLRLGLERGRTAAEAVEAMTDLIGRYGQGKFENDAGVRTYDNGYIVADPNEAYVLETAGRQWAVKQVDGALGISNVYSVETDWKRLSPEAESLAVEQKWWEGGDARFNFADAYTRSSRSEGSGAMRRARSCAVLNQQAGSIDARTMMALLSDHSDGQSPDEPFQTAVKARTGICVHTNEDGTGDNTAASLVADLCADGSRLPVYWCSFYSPCLGLFLPVFIEGDLPAVLSAGDETPGDGSPWWCFHRLSRLARAQPDIRIPRVRDRWAAIQNRLFDTACTTAAEGKSLIDDGRTEAAKHLLTGYMEKNVSEMLETVSAMLDEFETQAETKPARSAV